MFAVFFTSETMEIPGVENHSIHVFASEKAADQFILDGLVKAGRITEYDGWYYVNNIRCGCPADAILDAQSAFGPSEYFHAYPVVDHCDMTPRVETIEEVERLEQEVSEAADALVKKYEKLKADHDDLVARYNVTLKLLTLSCTADRMMKLLVKAGFKSESD